MPQRHILQNKFSNIIEVVNYFNSDLKCRQYLEKYIWNNKPACRNCGNIENIYRFKDNKTLKCSKCLKKFTIITGTFIENSNLPLQKWLVALFTVCSNKKGISSVQLGKTIGVTQKTAWFMLCRIREMLADKEKQPLSDIVEVDETYIGGKYKNKHWKDRKQGSQGRSGVDKIIVFGMLEREGKVRTCHVQNSQIQTLTSVVHENVKSGTCIMSDEWHGYNKLKENYIHHRVHHQKNQYVNGIVHTNTIEGYWGHLKRNITGIYHNVSKKHIERYLAEFDFRYNNKYADGVMRLNMALSGSKGKLKYKQLTL